MDIITGIEERRSINFFQPGLQIPPEKLKRLLELANLAPSSFNLQPWRVIVVKSGDRKKVLRKCAFEQPKVEEASVVLITIADQDAVELNAERALDSWEQLGYIKDKQQRDMYRGMMGALYGEKGSNIRKRFAVKNTSLFAMNLMLAARGLGLETHPMDGFDEAAVKKEFNIPEDKIVPMLIAVGYLKDGVDLLPRAFRRKIEEFTSVDSY